MNLKTSLALAKRKPRYCMPIKKAPVAKTVIPQIKNYVAIVKFEDLSVFDSVVFA